MPLPIVFLGGLSGAGKSTVARHLEKEGFLWVEVDLPGQDGIDVYDLRVPWQAFCRKQPAPIANELRRRAQEARLDGTVMSFPSNAGLTFDRIEAANRVGICTVLLVGLPHHCLAAFLEREQRTGRGFDKARWKRFNASVVGELSKREYDDVRLETFQKDGSHFPCETLAATIRERATKLLGQSAIES